MTERIIIHLDLDAFFCIVEELRNPQLRGKPFAVGGLPNKRGVVASCSYPARMFGVRSAMPTSRALQLCPQLIIVRPQHDAYREVSEQVMAILQATTPFVEQISIDEAFLDMTGFGEEGLTIAQRLQKHINTELGLSCSLGIASNKLIAKIANNLGKARQKKGVSPNALEVVPFGQEAAYLAPLPIDELWGVGPKTAERLQKMGMHTIGDLAKQSEAFLIQYFGKNGYDMHLRARGIDGRLVETEHDIKSVSRETTFDVDIADAEILRKTLRQLADSVGRQLRKSALRGTTVKIKLRWSDFTTLTRQVTFKNALDDDQLIYNAALDLLYETWDAQRPIRLIGVGVSGFEQSAQQLSLWEDAESKTQRQVQRTVDDLRERFGSNSLKRGSDL